MALPNTQVEYMEWAKFKESTLVPGQTGMVVVNADGSAVGGAAGPGGGGAAQTQVRSGTNIWTDVGYFTGNLNMPVQAADGAIVSIGTTSDAATLSTVIGRLKALVNLYPAAAALADATVNPTLTQASVYPMGFNGVTWDRLKSTTGALNVAVQGTVPVSGTFWQATQPVSGTFFQATQPVSLAAAVTANQGTANTVANAWPTKITDGTNTLTVKPASSAAAANTDPMVVIGIRPDSSTVFTNPPTLTKGTQSASGYSVQDLKDSGRVNIMWTLNGLAATQTAELLPTITESRDGAAVTTFVGTKVVTSGKRLRITSITGSIELTTNTTTTNINRNRLRVRFNTAGAVTTASPLQYVVSLPSLTGSPKATAVFFEDFPDGIEFLGDGTKQIGVTWESPDWVSGANVCTLYLSIFGFEY